MHTHLCNLLCIEHPIIQASLGPWSSVGLVAVSNAGGPGSLGTALRSAEEIDQRIAQLRQLTEVIPASWSSVRTTRASYSSNKSRPSSKRARQQSEMRMSSSRRVARQLASVAPSVRSRCFRRSLTRSARSRWWRPVASPMDVGWRLPCSSARKGSTLARAL